MYQCFDIYLSCFVVNYWIEKEGGNILICFCLNQLGSCFFCCNWRWIQRCVRFFCGVSVYLFDKIPCWVSMRCPTQWPVVGFISDHIWVFWTVVTFSFLPYFFCFVAVLHLLCHPQLYLSSPSILLECLVGSPSVFPASCCLKPFLLMNWLCQTFVVIQRNWINACMLVCLLPTFWDCWQEFFMPPVPHLPVLG